MRLPNLTQFKNARWGRVTAVIGVCLSAALLAGIAYEQIGRWRDRRQIAQIGKSVDIGGRTLNIHCSGEGSPVVVFESPGAGPGCLWQPIQNEVAKFTRSCWYDRAGEGWSDPGPFPRTSAAIAKDLHELLRRAGEAAPYLLVGASFGGLNARVYGGLYLDETAGFVLVDSAHEDEPKRAPKFFLAPTPPRYLWRPLDLAFSAAAGIGLIRLTQSSRLHTDGGTPSEIERNRIVGHLSRQSKSVASNALTGIVMSESYAEARSVAGLGDRPLIVLTAGKPLLFGDPNMDRAAADYQRVWISQMQAQLARLSTRGRQIVVRNSDHAITEHAPEVVVTAIHELVAEIRREK